MNKSLFLLGSLYDNERLNAIVKKVTIAKIVTFSKALDLPFRFNIAMAYLYCMESISM